MSRTGRIRNTPIESHDGVMSQLGENGFVGQTYYDGEIIYEGDVIQGDVAPIEGQPTEADGFAPADSGPTRICRIEST